MRHDGHEVQLDHALRGITARTQDQHVVRLPAWFPGANDGVGAIGTGGCRDSDGRGRIRPVGEGDLTDGVIESNNLALSWHHRKALFSPTSGGHFFGD